MFNHALILAAGKGERMLPLTKYVPKALVEVDGIPLISHVVHQLTIPNYIDNVHITYGHMGAKLLNNVFGAQSLINTKGKGNAWVLFNSLIKYVNEPIVVVPCDIIFECDFKKIFEEYISFGSPACCIVTTDFIDGIEGDFVTSVSNQIIRMNRHSITDRYASGIQILNPAKINSLMDPKDNFSDVWNILIQKKEIYESSVKPSIWRAYDNIKDIR